MKIRDFHENSRYSRKSEIFAKIRDFRLNPRFSRKSRIFKKIPDFRENPRFLNFAPMGDVTFHVRFFDSIYFSQPGVRMERRSKMETSQAVRGTQSDHRTHMPRCPVGLHTSFLRFRVRSTVDRDFARKAKTARASRKSTKK